MKPFRNAHALLARRFFQNNPFFSAKAFAFVFAALAFSACQDEPVPPQIPLCPPHENPTCQPDTYVTVEPAGCATGVWHSLWFKLDNGQWLQPYTSADTAQIHPGQRFKIDYDVVTRDGRYDHEIICQALPPASTPIRINCMEEVIINP